MRLLPILIIIVFGEVACAAPYLVPYTHAQEKEVKSFITIGMDEQTVEKRFGPPNLTNTETPGLEVWEYLLDPRIMRDSHSSYAGFEVFFKNKKVTDLGITRASY